MNTSKRFPGAASTPRIDAPIKAPMRDGRSAKALGERSKGPLPDLARRLCPLLAPLFQPRPLIDGMNEHDLQDIGLTRIDGRICSFRSELDEAWRDGGVT